MLGYARWENFATAIERAKDICLLLHQDASRHFADTNRGVQIGKGAERETVDCRLTWFSLHLVLLCSDLNKPEVIQALAIVALTQLEMDSDRYAIAQIRDIPELGE